MKYTIISKQLVGRPSAQDIMTGETPEVIQTITIEGLTYEQARATIKALEEAHPYKSTTRGIGRLRETGQVKFYHWD